MSREYCVYFGGSFDPPHIGHLDMLVALAEDPWCQRVFLVPTSINPLKAADKSNALWSSAKNRLLWTQSLMREASKIITPGKFSKVILIDSEIRQPDKTAYTVETLAKLQNENPECHDWALAIGSDLVSTLHQWKDAQTLLKKLSSVWIFPRNRENKVLLELNEELKDLCEFRIMAREVPPVSSTQIREALSKDAGGASCRELIPGQVLESIQSMLI